MDAVPVKSADSKKTPTVANGGAPMIPTWVDEDHFIGVLEENVDGFAKIINFDARLFGGAGENYASIMLGIRVDIELKDGSTKQQSFMIKTGLQGKQSAEALKSLGYFPKEQEMYGVLLPEFEQMYKNAGKKVRFGPKMYKFKKDPGEEYILMEDLKQESFKNVDRRKGLDQEHTESVLRLLAELHAASAVRYETKGQYDESFTSNFLTKESREMIDNVIKSLQGFLLESLAKNETTSKYVEKMKKLQDDMLDLYYRSVLVDPEEFSVILHGDLWANNIMFRHNDEGKREDTVFVDFQISRYSSPAVDLFYFLLSSTALELKLAHFDNFIKYYYDHLVENLQLLCYPKKLPTLKELRMQLLKHSLWCASTMIGVMAAALLDPTENASFENFMEEGEQGQKFKMQLYDSPRFIRHMEAILPWLDTRGLLD